MLRKRLHRLLSVLSLSGHPGGGFHVYTGLKLKGEALAGETDLGVMICTQVQYKPCEWVPGPKMRIQNGKRWGSRNIRI